MREIKKKMICEHTAIFKRLKGKKAQSQKKRMKILIKQRKKINSNNEIKKATTNLKSNETFFKL